MVNLRSAAHRPEGKTVDFLVGLEGIARKLDAHITQHTRVVSIIIATVPGAWTALDLHLRLVVLGLSADDDTTPVTGFALSGSLFRGEYDRSGGRALCDEFAAPLADERSLGLLVALDDGTRLDGQFGSVGDIDPSFQQIGAFLQGLLAGEYKFGITVADLVSLGILAVVHLAEEEMVTRLDSSVSSPGIFLRGSHVRVVVVVVTAA